MVDRYEFKSDEVGYLDRRRTHLYVFEIDTEKMTQVTSGDFDDEAPAWSPDGKSLAFSSKRTMPDPDRNYDRNIFVVAADNTDKGASPTQVTTNPGSDAQPEVDKSARWEVDCVCDAAGSEAAGVFDEARGGFAGDGRRGEGSDEGV